MRKRRQRTPTPFTVDLEKQTINGAVRFEIAPRRKKMLLEGLDEIGLTLALEPKIAAFQAADRARRPWIYPGKWGQPHCSFTKAPMKLAAARM